MNEKRPTQYIRFVGNFRDLKPLGYVFQKLYARNYNTWRKSVDPNGYRDTIWIWQKWRIVEFNDLYGWSALILQEVVLNGRKGHRHKPCAILPNPDETGHFILDLQTGELLDYTFELSDTYKFCRKQLGVGEDPTDEELREHYNRYRTVNIPDEFLPLVQELLDKKMIEIRERVLTNE